MQRAIFKGIISKYQTDLKDIKNNAALHKIYSKFSFTFFPCANINENQINFNEYLLNYMKQFKFFTYSITQRGKISENSPSLIVDIVICVENECMIIENLEYDSFHNLLTELRSQKISSLNSSANILDSTSDYYTNEEVESFCNNFPFLIKNNKFIKLTIRSISSFLIRRYFYPTEFFKDPSFFNFNERDLLKDENIKMKINNLLFFNKEAHSLNKNEMKKEFRSIKKEIIYNNTRKTTESVYFNINDFILLRVLNSTEKATFYLAFHLENLHVFVMKKFHYNQDNVDIIKREIDFCKNYSHRCLMHFYGFVEDGKRIIGLIYEHLSNGTLDDYIKSNKEKINDIYSLNLILRIFQGIEYLHSNSFIYRDLKPQNILIDHDNIPYIADFDTIRHPIDEKQTSEVMTLDIGSDLYASPEQIKGNFVSYPADIYSFGLIIYFIFEMKNMFNQKEISLYFNNDYKIPTMSNVSNNIQNLVKSCIKLNQSERPKIQDIKLSLFKEFIMQYYIEPHISNNNTVNINSDINCFIYENILIRLNNPSSMNSLFEEIFIYKNFFFRHHVEKKRMICFIDMGDLFGFTEEEEEEEYIESLSELEYYELLAQKNDSFAQFKLGNLYYDGKKVQQDYIKAKNYYMKSAQQNNIMAMLKLGELYLNGFGVEKDYNKAKDFFVLSAQNNNLDSFVALGYLYYNGFGVEQNYTIARKYFEYSADCDPNAQYYLGLIYFHGKGVNKNFKIAKDYFESAAESRDKYSLYYLGLFYENGFGVEQDYVKAKEYYELAAEENCSQALNCLGALYYDGKGVGQNISKAFNYYNLAAKQGDIFALVNLGVIYRDGYVKPKDYLRALYYFELASKSNDSSALYFLGDLYFRGYGVEKNYSKAKSYFELSAKMNNHFAFLILGDIYYEGLGVEKDYLKAKRYYEFSSYFNNFIAIFKLGVIYLNGVDGIEINILKAKQYFEQSAQLNYPNAMYYLGNLYSFGDFRDINKAIEYFLNCIKIHKEYIRLYDNQFISLIYINNDFFYCSYNNLGVIYITIFNDIDNAYNYLKEAAFNEFPYGQNNLGLLYQFYYNNIEKAIYMFERSMKNKFALAAFNIAYIKENEGKIVESIEYYKKASLFENEPLFFHDIKYIDERLEISKKFIICLANLIVTKYYFKQKLYDESKKYFIKAFNINKNSQYKFKLIFYIDELKRSLSYLKLFIFNFPLYNLNNHLNINLDLENINDENSKSQSSINFQPKFEINKTISSSFNNNNKENADIDSKEKVFFNDPGKLFDFISKNENLKIFFIEQIEDIIVSMKSILYTCPYSILFGRINIEKPKQTNSDNELRKNINAAFYDGYGID